MKKKVMLGMSGGVTPVAALLLMRGMMLQVYPAFETGPLYGTMRFRRMLPIDDIDDARRVAYKIE